MKQEKRIAIIYLPNGNERIYTTSTEIGDEFYKVCKSIVVDPTPEVTVTYEEDGEDVVKTYVGMPYELEIFVS